MVAKKTKSKRLSLQKKYKIVKRTKEHHKRLKKDRIHINGKKAKNKDNFIPNSWPYKEELLKEIKSAQERMEEVKLRQKEKRAEEIMKRRMDMDKMMDIDPSQTSNGSNSSNNNDNGNNNNIPIEEERSLHHPNLGQNSRRAYLKELKKVVESADVILHVLDARDPTGTRSSAIEDMVLSNSRKKLVYVLNKADLVPKDILTGWLSYLRKLHPTIPFKCNTQSGSGNLGRIGGKVSKHNDSALQTSQAVGAEELIGLLKNYCRSGDTKSIISVGIVGFPNVGKSSLINSLLRSRAVGVSSMPGFTKISQEVVLDKNIRLVDSPGVVFADGDSASTALRNCVNVEELEDVMTPIQAILDRCPQPYLMQLYMIPKFKPKDTMAFLGLVAKVTGRLKKGGIPNVDAAARAVLHDWNNGKIKYYCKPPKVISTRGGIDESTKIVNQFSEELDISDLREEDITVLNAIEAQQESNSSYIGMNEVADRIDIHIGDDKDGNNNDDDDDISNGNNSNVNIQTNRSKSSLSSKKSLSKKSLASMMGTNNNRTDSDDSGHSNHNENDRKSFTSNSTRKSLSSSFHNKILETVIDEDIIGTDIRKLQKQMKKKAIKASRKSMGNSSNHTNVDYSFDEDFQYD